MTRTNAKWLGLLLTVAALGSWGCENNAPYTVLAWNDLGMHCLNPTYDEGVLLPPYNTVWAQVVKRGNPPQVVTAGLTAEYRILNNTFSYGKTDSYGGDFAQFWDTVLDVFGVSLPIDKGLNLADPLIHNGLSGQMVVKGDHFQVDGIPVTPVNDAGAWSPYQVAEITIKSAGAVVAQTRATVPTSDEINCARCHGANALHDVLVQHPLVGGQSLVDLKPVLCAGCHGSPVLGGSGPGSSGKYLSQAIHGSHAARGAACLDCHPGEVTKCSRSLAHTSADGNCVTCHGTMQQVASSIASGARIPWVNEPACATCHTGVAGVGTGATLYRNAKGHGDLYCAGCHQSPHAMIPSRQASDNYQALQLQGSNNTLGSCSACHGNSHGEGFGEFWGKHGGSNPDEDSACQVCHTGVPTNVAAAPHSFTWKSR